MKDSTRRPLRTAYQFLVALVGIIPTIVMLLPDSVRNGKLGALDLSAILASVLVWVLTISKVINELEDRGYIPAWLKAPASDGANPVPNDAGAIDLSLVSFLLGVAAAVLTLALFGRLNL